MLKFKSQGTLQWLSVMHRYISRTVYDLSLDDDNYSLCLGLVFYEQPLMMKHVAASLMVLEGETTETTSVLHTAD